MKNIEKFYDETTEREWKRLARGRLQFDIAMRMFSEYLPDPVSEIADVGGGVGRYAAELTKKGYKVTLVDKSTNALRFSGDRAADEGVEIFRTFEENWILANT